MAQASATRSIVGVILIIVGVGFGMWAWHESQTLGNEIASTLTGNTSTDVVVACVAGVICLIAGLVLLFRRG